jgi:APA family basic amino acid/polyamine antiporter
MSKSLGFWRSWALVVGTMIGSGVFLLPAVLAPYGSYSLLGWVVAGTGTLFIALTLGSMARRVPKIGGPYAYTRAAFGDLPGFLIAWGYWISVWSGSAAIAVAFSGYMSVFIPALDAVPAAGAGGALVVIWLFTGVNIIGVRTVGIVQLVTTLLKLLPLFAVAAAGLVAGDATAIPATNPDEEPLPLLVAGVAMLTMWAFVGMEAATIPADDVVAPERTIPRALVAGTLTATGVYILATLGVMALVPTGDLAASSSPFADAAASVWGSWGVNLIGVGALVSIVGALNSNILLSGQMPRAAALDGLFLSRFARLNASGAPAFALVVSAGLASALIVMNYAKGLLAAFEFMIVLSTLTTLVPYAASALADLVFQRRTDRGVTRWRSIAVAVLALLFSLFAIIGSGVEVVGYGLLLLAAGLPVYYGVTRGTS